jgi:hypothetical protein
VTFTDTLPDSQIIGNQQLYTTGGELENIAAPSVAIGTTYKSRAIVIPSESPLQWWFSKQVIPGQPVEFNDFFYENVDSRIGAVTAVKSLDEKLILFGASSKYYVVGDGPAPSGANNDFSPAQRLAGVSGCQNQASIVETPLGLMYQDKVKGIYLLDRSLQESYIGAEVEAYNSNTVVSARIISGQTIVRFALDSGVCLTYDYIVGQWGVDIYPAPVTDAENYNNLYTYVTTGGIVNQETVGSYTDSGALIPLAFTTGWLSFENIEGFMRIYEMQIFGTYYSPHTLTIQIYVNYGANPSQTVTIPVTSSISPYQHRIKLAVQQCESIKISVVESQSSSFGQGLAISGLTFRVGIKSGMFKLPASQSY